MRLVAWKNESCYSREGLTWPLQPDSSSEESAEGQQSDLQTWTNIVFKWHVRHLAVWLNSPHKVSWNECCVMLKPLSHLFLVQDYWLYFDGTLCLGLTLNCGTNLICCKLSVITYSYFAGSLNQTYQSSFVNCLYFTRIVAELTVCYGRRWRRIRICRYWKHFLLAWCILWSWEIITWKWYFH